MRTEPLLTPGGTAADARGAPTSRRPRGDVIAVVLLVTLPMVIFGVPALLGHAVLPADDLSQNFPLRVLVGREIRAGHLPLYDPYIWSGAPLLAGWNAAAAYPLSWLFAALPATAAWTVGVIVTWAVTGLGMFRFLRALGLATVASVLGTLSFGYAGAMFAQVSHFGLVAGMSWVPVELLAVLRLSQDRPAASRLGWTAVLATAMGLTILAGEPRAVDDACVLVVIYAAWQVARARRSGPGVLSITAGLALGACLGAVQWLPGLAAISTSQRAAGSMALFSSGSLPVRWLLLTLVPDLLGGSGSLGQPSFFAQYNLTEVTSYVGMLPLVAAFALLGRVRLRRRPQDWIVWHCAALVGIMLALGGNTPLGGVLYHLPLFGDQRLQSRNVLVLDLALAVLFGYWADQPFGRVRLVPGRPARPGRLSRLHAVRRETVLGVVPPLAAVMVVAAGFTWGAGLLRWLGVGVSDSADVIGRLQPWLVPYAVLGAGAVALVLVGRRLGPRLRSRVMVGFVVVDLIVFTVLGVLVIRPGPSGGAGGSSGPAAGRPVAAPAAPRPIGTLGYAGRFAIYDPDLLDPSGLAALDPPDLNVVDDPAMPSVQGYSSIVDGRYAAATGAHQATGEGQAALAPRAVTDGTLDQLDTSVLLTVSAYLVTKVGGNGPAAGPAGTGRRDIGPGQRATWYLGAPLTASAVEIPDAGAGRDAAAGTRIGLTTRAGSTRWFPARASTPSTLAITLPQPMASTAVVVQTPGRPVGAGRPGVSSAPGSLGPPSVAVAGGSEFVADGQLQDALAPSHWKLVGFDGWFAVFANRRAKQPLSIAALPGRSTSGAWIRTVSGAPTAPTAAAVFSPHGVRVVRSVAAIPGWSASWQPRHGRTRTLAVHRDGVVQAVDVPAGLGVVTWSYLPPGFPAGLAVSLAATAVVLALFLLFLAARRARRSSRSAVPQPGATATGDRAVDGGPS